MYQVILLVLIAASLVAGDAPAPAPDWLERQAAVVRALEDAARAREAGVQSTDADSQALRAAVSQLQQQVDEAKLTQATEALKQRVHPSPKTDPRFGSLVLFWHFRAPQAETLVPVLHRLRSAIPGLPISQKHLMAPSGWEDFLFAMKQASVQMESMAKAGDPTVWDLYRQVTDETRALTAVCDFFQIPGVSPFDRVSSGVKWRVDVLPSWRYSTRRGIVHGLTGCGPNLDLASWVMRCESWDDRREAEAQQRNLTLGVYLATYRPAPGDD
jgi:hypothetical protein